MNTAAVKYLGNLRTEATHLRSGTRIVTDAPVDNHGKGEAFSPTDLVGAALLTCAITTMALAAEGRGWNLGEIDGEYLKVMVSAPRRIHQLLLTITFKNSPLDADQRAAMESIGTNCPVAKSLHPDLIQEIHYHYVEG
jgi:putative redox protein